METSSYSFTVELVYYLFLIIIMSPIIFGIRLVYIGVKNKQKWAIITAIVLTILFVLTVIGSLVFYRYAIALGDVFEIGF